VAANFVQAMQLQINGEPREVADGLTVAALLSALDIKAPRVAVEVNAEVVVKSRHAETTLRSGDQVEIVTFVGGG
jgi:sulfur carrier protein